MRIVVNSSIKHLSWLEFSKDMEITRQFIRICVIIFGILVLSSYVYGLSKAEDKMVLWGGIPHSWIKFIVPWMLITWMVDLLVDHSIQRRRFSYRSVTLAMARFSRWEGCKSAILGLLCIHDSIYAVVRKYTIPHQQRLFLDTIPSNRCSNIGINWQHFVRTIGIFGLSRRP